MPDKTPQIVLDIVAFVTSKPMIAVLSFFAGIAAAIIPQWNQWCIKRQEIALTNKFNSNKERINRWREEIAKHDSLATFTKTSTYHELRSYISAEEIKQFFQPQVGIQTITPDQRLLNRFHEIITQKEKEWGI